jgi:hypothetical protein
MPAASANNRLRRAQQLRSNRKGGGPTSASAGGDDDDALVLTGSLTLVIALVIVGIGAGLAMLFFSIHHPGCMQGMSFGMGSLVTPETTQTAVVPKATMNLRRKLMWIEEEEEAEEGAVLLP